MAFKTPNQYRVLVGPLATDDDSGNNGAFLVPIPGGHDLRVLASDIGGWEHVSVSLPNRCPTWEEMCLVKSLFWDDTDAAMQLHLPLRDHVNNHPYCLHLWRPIGLTIPMPPSIMVGIRDIGVLPMQIQRSY